MSNLSESPAAQFALGPGTSSRDAGAGQPGARVGEAREPVAEAAVTELYHQHALGLTRLAHVMLGSRASAEDVVQEAFYGLYRRWDRLTDKRKAPQYLRSCVLNGCRSELRRARRRNARPGDPPASVPAVLSTASAEAAVLADEDRHAVLAGIMRLPDRQREVLVLRYYLDESETAIAELLGIAHGTVRSTVHRALKALGADLRVRS
jgi:RNA polymerase sigma-70 factor (sigma-E family)